MFRTIVIPLTILLLSAGRVSAAVEIHQCGSVVPEGETAYLVSDLDCDGESSEAVVLSNHSRLMLGGYAIFANGEADGPERGVRCRTGSVCTVVGPGSISGFAASGIAGTRVRARDIVVSDNGRAGIVAYENIVLHNTLIENNGSLGAHAAGRLRAYDSEIAPHPVAAGLEWRAPAHRPQPETCRQD
jgi:hypothetical protein